MKTLILENATLFSGKILVFEPEGRASNLNLNDYEKGANENRAIYYETSHRDGYKIVLSRFIPQTDIPILHQQSLERLFILNPHYFAKIYEEAKKEEFNTDNTFICETPGERGLELFCDEVTFRENLLQNKLFLEEYDDLFSLDAFKSRMSSYFKDQVNKETFMSLWNYSIDSGSDFRRFLSNYLLEYNKQHWKKKDLFRKNPRSKKKPSQKSKEQL